MTTNMLCAVCTATQIVVLTFDLDLKLVHVALESGRPTITHSLRLR